MSSDSNRRKLWKEIGLNSRQMEDIFRSARSRSLTGKISDEMKTAWIEKTNRVMALFDFLDIPRPVHGKTGLPRPSSLAGYAALWDALSTIEIPVLGVATGLTKDDLASALTKLGALALRQGTTIKLAVVGGAAMLLGYAIKRATHDMDVLVVAPKEVSSVRKMAKAVAEEMNWADDWLNDGAKGYLRGISEGRQVFSAPGIEVFMPSAPQLLAMKLVAWRSAKDEMDAARILGEMSTHTRDVIVPKLVKK